MVDFVTESDSLDNIPEDFRPLYAESDGKYVIDEKFSKVAGAITGLNNSLKTARKEAKEAARTSVDISPLSEFGASPEEIKKTFTTKMKDLQDQLAATNSEDAKLNLEKIRDDLAKSYAVEIKNKEERSKALEGQLYSLLVENAASSAIVEAKGVPELLLPFVKGQIKAIEEEGEFKVFVVDESGDRRYSPFTGQPMTIKELVSEFKTNEKYGRLFESDSSQGGGMLPNSGRKPFRSAGKDLTSSQKIASGLNNRKR